MTAVSIQERVALGEILLDDHLTLAWIRLETGALQLPFEDCGNGIIITPAFGLDRETRAQILGGGFLLTHQRTGYRFPGTQWCINCCRAAGRRLAETEFDWGALVDGDTHGKTKPDALPERALRAWGQASAILRRCEAVDCDA